ncbi:MAG: hypothetical protein QG639_801 [Patescibacteria group bacterium]|nr:hypothetical protein [Patescibacteria group bacterium]
MFKYFSIQKILLFAAILYFTLAPLTYHPDNKLVLYWAGLENGRVLDIWKYGQEHFPDAAQFNYPPGHYFLDKAQYFLARAIGGEKYDMWLSGSNGNDAQEPQLPLFALATKAGLILFSLLLGYLIYILVLRQNGDKTKALSAAALWLFNPITIYSIPIMGQNDVLALAVFVCGWLLLKSKPWLAGLIIGLAASIKTFPLIWLPFLLLATYTLSWKQRLISLSTAVLAYVLVLAPYISNPWFRSAVLESSLNDRFLFAQVAFWQGEAVSVVPLLLLVVCVALFVRKHIPEQQLAYQAMVLMIVNLILLGFTHFHPQWWTWVVLFWSVWIVFQRSSVIILTAILSVLSIISWLVVILLFPDRYLSLNLFVPLNPLIDNLPMIREVLLLRDVNVEHNANLAHTWLAGVSVLALSSLFFFAKQGTPSLLLPDVNFRIRTPKFLTVAWLRKTIMVLSMTLLVISLFAFAHLIPSPNSYQPADVRTYIPITSNSTDFTAPENNLSRVDLYLRNPGLESTEVFIFDIFREDSSEPFFSQTISGLNIGDTSTVRVDISPEISSANAKYRIRVQSSNPLVANENGLLIGVSDVESPTTSVAVKTYYEAKSLEERIQIGFQRMLEVMHQLPVLFLAILLILILIA